MYPENQELISDVTDKVRDYLKKRGKPHRIQEFDEEMAAASDLTEIRKICNRYFPNFSNNFNIRVENQKKALKESAKNDKGATKLIVMLVISFIIFIFAGIDSNWDGEVLCKLAAGLFKLLGAML